PISRAHPILVQPMLPVAFTPTLLCAFLFLLLARPPASPLFPYTTLFRSSLRSVSAARRSLPSLPCLRRPFSPVRRGRKRIPSPRSEEHTSELQSRFDLVCRLLLEKKKRQSCREAAI